MSHVSNLSEQLMVRYDVAIGSSEGLLLWHIVLTAFLSKYYNVHTWFAAWFMYSMNEHQLPKWMIRVGLGVGLGVGVGTTSLASSQAEFGSRWKWRVCCTSSTIATIYPRPRGTSSEADQGLNLEASAISTWGITMARLCLLWWYIKHQIVWRCQ